MFPTISPPCARNSQRFAEVPSQEDFVSPQNLYMQAARAPESFQEVPNHLDTSEPDVLLKWRNREVEVTRNPRKRSFLPPRNDGISWLDQQAYTSQDVIEIKSLQELKDCCQQNPAVVLKNYASWCPPCKQYGSIFKELAKKNPECAFAEANVDYKVMPVKALPTTMFIYNGNICGDYTVEGLNPRQIQSNIERFLRDIKTGNINTSLEPAPTA